MPKTSVEEIFDKYAKGYSSNAFAPTRYDTARAAMSFADDITWHFLTKYLPKRKSITILDAGGGDGYWAQKLVELGYKNIVIADISQGMLDEAAKRFAKLKTNHNATFVKSDITNMKEFQTAHFDYVFSQYDAVSLCMKPAQAIKELARVAKKGAYVIASLDTKFRRVPELIQAGKINEAEQLLKTNISYDCDFPQHNLTYQELTEYFTIAGLTVIEIIGAPVFMHQVDQQILQKLEADPKIRNKLLKMELAHCTNTSLVNFAGHLQIVRQKP
ncbi:MAG TPA: methyltransferase domain-containing protein [Candidatus Bathyarchaeia archaeon]|nr:methyltransferase domain-containing protein [Candidatus Bathyarchaeia archaeon]